MYIYIHMFEMKRRNRLHSSSQWVSTRLVLSTSYVPQNAYQVIAIAPKTAENVAPFEAATSNLRISTNNRPNTMILYVLESSNLTLLCLSIFY